MSFHPYPAYKDSGVEWLGKVPAHWSVCRLRYAATLNPSKSEVRGLPADTSVTFLPMDAVGEDGSLDLTGQRTIGEVIDGYTYLREADVVYAKITPCFENGKAALVRGTLNGVAFGTTELTVLRPVHQNLIPEYLYRVISSEPFRTLGEGSMYGAGGQKRVPENFARDFTLAWPPLPEQRIIADFLDHETARIDALIEEQQRLVELLKEKRQAVISYAVTKGLDLNVSMKDSGVEWLGEVPAHWSIVQFRRVMKGDLLNGLYKGQEYKTPEATAFVQMGEAFSDRVFTGGTEERLSVTQEELSKWRLTEGDLIFARRSIVLEGSGRCTRIGEIAEDHVFESSMIRARISSDKALPSYLHWVFDSSPIRQQIIASTKTVTISGIDGPQLKSVLLPLPPKQEQSEIAQHIDRITATHEHMEKEAENAVMLLKERRSALISAAVTGKIDIRGWEPPVSDTKSPRSTAGELPA